MASDALHRLVMAVVTASAGAVIGWSASALTLAGRVSAIEASMARIEAHLDRLDERQRQRVAPPVI
ncbi:hypothetical protein [Sphaerotilus mobilis]|uniref:Uncharacterized protein n=1 Tax=Sphaerotilus mobilis TaxID=47994 RepID=A0A4Q7LPQ2_9BURK|nr:hypothetical protein [Sphaerotilus mobilis]RZS56725.1 hypothetical protein EV685_1279 [Sphaerotilus mobilis]